MITLTTEMYKRVLFWTSACFHSHFGPMIEAPQQVRLLEFEHCLFSPVQDGICALGKTRMRSIQVVRRFPNIAFETVIVYCL